MRSGTILKAALLLLGGLALDAADATPARAANDGLRSLLQGLGPTAPPKGDVSVRAWVERGAGEPAELVVRLEPRGAAKLSAEQGVIVTPVAGDGVAWEVQVLLQEEPGRGYWKTPVDVRLPFAADDGVRIEALVEYAYCLVESQCLFGEAKVAAVVEGGSEIGAVSGIPAVDGRPRG